jgi:hypothetical protein
MVGEKMNLRVTGDPQHYCFATSLELLCLREVA